jgi:hypothetical protein
MIAVGEFIGAGEGSGWLGWVFTAALFVFATWLFVKAWRRR